MNRGRGMETPGLFGEVLEAIDQLSLEEQETLSEVLSRRLIECRRDELAQDVKQAEQELEEGNCRVVSPADIISEILQ